MENEVKTKHNLDFGCYKWEPPIPSIEGLTYYAFRVGTCDGLYTVTRDSYDIIAIRNSIKGNGHFEDVLQWFENSCRRDGKSLRFLECWNKAFKMHLVIKRGFSLQGKDNVIKKVK